MIFSKDYVGYLARQTVKHLVAEKMIHTEKPTLVNERVAAAMVDELSLEDRINDEVRVILEAFQDDMRKTGASYPEMFKKVKNELARKYKAVLMEETKIDAAARMKISSQRKIITEGAQEGDILYRKYYNDEVKKLGL